ncbi:MAG: amidohydrolase family protein [Acidobacteriota bacterium]
MDLRDYPAIDHHAHNLLRPEDADSNPYAAAFTEATDGEAIKRHARHTLFFRRSLRDVAGLLECEPTEEAILTRRRELGFDRLASICFEAANLSEVFLDDGFLPDRVVTWEDHRRFVPVRRILRLEYLAETLMEEAKGFEDFLERFSACLDPPPAGVIGLKSIAAYRSGLAIESISHEAARSSFEAMRLRPSGRLMEKPLIDFLLARALDLAARYRLPVQFHTGLGDPDMDLRLGNPLHLRPILENGRWRNVPIVLLHAGYPFVRETGYLAAVYPQVHADFGLAVPFLSVSGMRAVLRDLLALTPSTKILFSSDAHLIPELFYLGAKWGRAILGDVLDEAVRDSDLTVREAEEAAERILARNAVELYRID